METTWVAVGRTLQDLTMRCAELGAAPDPAWAGLPIKELATTVRLTEARERLVCDVLIRQLLQPGGAIGKPTPPQLLFCSMRCHCALDTLGILHAELDDQPLYPVPPSWPVERLLEWLLVSNWQQRHDTWLKLSALSAATGLGIYSG